MQVKKKSEPYVLWIYCFRFIQLTPILYASLQCTDLALDETVTEQTDINPTQFT